MKLVPRALKNPTFTAGAMEPFVLPVKNIVHHWQLILAFAFTVTGGSGIGTLFSDMHGRILRKWVLYGNGKPLITMTGQTLAIYALLFMREVYQQTPPTALAAATNQAARELRLMLPATMGLVANPKQEASFGFPPVTDPSMEFHWGDEEDLARGTDGVLAMVGTTARLLEYRYDDAAPPAGGYAPLLARTQEQAVNGVEDLIFNLTELEAGYELRALIIEGLADGQAGGRDFQYNDSVVTSIGVLDVNGVERHKDLRFADVQQQNKVDYMLASLGDLTGIAVIDAAADGDVGRGELWQHNVRSTPYLQLAVAKQGADANKVRVTSIFTAR